MEIRRDPTFRWLAKMKGDPRSCDPTKFCEYHGENGHFTKDCINLSHEIESFIINRKLVRFLAHERNQGKNPQGPLLMEENQDVLRGLGPRCRDPDPRKDRYAKPTHNRCDDHRDDCVKDYDVQRPHQNR
jgi:hypothetical protein